MRSSLRIRLALLSSFAAFGVFACVGDDNGTGPDASTPDAAQDATTKDAAGDGSSSCSAACVADGSVFRDCDGGASVDTTCTFGCVGSPSPHCGVFDPAGPVDPSDFATSGVTDFDPVAPDAGQTLPAAMLVFHTDTGKIEDANANQIRPANANPAANEVANGIGFRVGSFDDAGANKLAIFEFKSFHLRGGEISFTGPNPVALVAATDVEIRGLIDTVDVSFLAYGCGPAAGGGAGGTYDSASSSLGGGGGGTLVSSGCGGGGGAANASNGGSGGTGFGINNNGGAAGQAFAEAFNPLRGGGGGGGGCGGVGGGGRGAAGGGAIAIYAQGTVTIAPGGGTSWGINAGGCGSPFDAYSASGGAGAGGTILVQGHAIVGSGGAGLAANGGSGGANSAGKRGALSTSPSQGTAEATCEGAGGNGATGTTAATNGQNPSSCNSTYIGGGGGGGVGRIGVGSYVPPSFDVDGGFILSPAPQTVTLPIQ